MEDFVEMQQTFLSAHEIRIVIVPVGKMTGSQFEYYVNVIKNFNSLEMIELSNEYKQGAFKLFNLCSPLCCRSFSES